MFGINGRGIKMLSSITIQIIIIVFLGYLLYIRFKFPKKKGVNLSVVLTFFLSFVIFYNYYLIDFISKDNKVIISSFIILISVILIIAIFFFIQEVTTYSTTNTIEEFTEKRIGMRLQEFTKEELIIILESGVSFETVSKLNDTGNEELKKIIRNLDKNQPFHSQEKT